jgi:hypothetical protein
MTTVSKPVITPSDGSGSHKTGELTNITVAQITSILGFGPNLPGGDGKVVNEWGFTCDGKEGAVWDWKGSERFNQFSTWGDDKMLANLFGSKYRKYR